MEVGGKMNLDSCDLVIGFGDMFSCCFMRASATGVAGVGPLPMRRWCDPERSGGGTGTPADWAK